MEELQASISRLEELKTQIDAVKPLKDEYDELREQVRFGLEALKLKSLKTDRVSVAIAERQSVQILDDATVEEWLEGNGFALDEYRRLDTARVSPVVLGRMKEDGEIVPGTQIVSTPYVTVKQVAKGGRTSN